MVTKQKVRRMQSGFTYRTNEYGVRFGEKTFTRYLLNFANGGKTQRDGRKMLSQVLQVPESQLQKAELEVTILIRRYSRTRR